MSKVTEQLSQWREERGISINGNIIESLEEEVDELDVALLNDDNHEIIDALCDIVVFSINEIEARGYEFEQCMLETIKEISSRKQDPKQKERWANDDKLKRLQKWKKFKEQDKKTLYKADYSKCKIKGKNNEI